MLARTPPSLIEEPTGFAVAGFGVAYGGVPVLSDVSFRLPTAGIVAIIGPNGAGKSTLLKAALGLVPRFAGTVEVSGAPYDPRSGAVAYVPQRASVDWDFPASALDVVTMGLYRRMGWLRPVGASHKALAREKLAMVGMADYADRQIGKLSGGQQQRVFIARALAQDAPVVLLDEPFAGVDAVTENVIREVFRNLAADGRLVVAVHHDLSTVEGLFDRVVLINGRLIAEGPTAEVFTPALIARTYGVPVAA